MEPWVIILIIIGVIVLIGLIVAVCYNSLVKLNERVKEAWSDITVQLKYRADLLPNLVETVKGYAKHEKEVFAEVTEARKMTLGGVNDPKSAAAAEKAMNGAIRSLFAVAEAYPELKSSENFKQLQGQLQDVEDKIQASRRFYNAGVQQLNTKIKTFPTVMINGMFLHFKEREYFEIEDSERETLTKAPEVKF